MSSDSYEEIASQERDDIETRSSSDDLGIDSDSGSDSESAAVRGLPDIPILLSVESPLLGPIITALNATSTGAALFANNGQDIVSGLDYDPEWWRRMPSAEQRPESTEQEWEQSVRVDLQRLNAFLSGEMKRTLAATGNLESLFRLKLPRSEKPVLEATDIFNYLATVPQVEQALVSYAVVEGESMALFPVPVHTDAEDSISLQDGLDEMFWSQYMNDADDEISENDIPTLQKICDVLVVLCDRWDTTLSEELWPQRYKQEHISTIKERHDKRRDIQKDLRTLHAELATQSMHEGDSLPKTLEAAQACLSKSGYAVAAREIGANLSQLQAKILQTQEQAAELENDLETEVSSKIDLDMSSEKPYVLKGVVIFDNDQMPSAAFTPSGDPDRWTWVQHNRHFVVSFDQLAKATSRSDSYIAVYERNDVQKEWKVSPALRKFSAQDDNFVNDYVSSSSNEDGDGEDFREETTILEDGIDEDRPSATGAASATSSNARNRSSASKNNNPFSHVK